MTSATALKTTCRLSNDRRQARLANARDVKRHAQKHVETQVSTPLSNDLCRPSGNDPVSKAS